jgi:hypothetical protein
MSGQPKAREQNQDQHTEGGLAERKERMAQSGSPQCCRAPARARWVFEHKREQEQEQEHE